MITDIRTDYHHHCLPRPLHPDEDLPQPAEDSCAVTPRGGLVIGRKASNDGVTWGVKHNVCSVLLDLRYENQAGDLKKKHAHRQRHRDTGHP